MTQREMMRQIYRRHGGRDDDLIIREYAAVETREDVQRDRNADGITPEDYARRLLADGKRKGWLS